MKELDMRGKACPIPVVEARRALEAEGGPAVTVLVDNAVAVQNLEKMARGRGYAFRSAQPEPGLYAVTLETCTTQEAVPPPKVPAPSPGPRGPTVLLSSECLGAGSEELGKILLKGFLFTLGEWAEPPEALLLLHGGVKLACEGSGTLADLRTLAAKDVPIRVCGTCLNYYQLTDALAVGEVTDMMDISQRLAAAPRVLTL